MCPEGFQFYLHIKNINLNILILYLFHNTLWVDEIEYVKESFQKHEKPIKLVLSYI